MNIKRIGIDLAKQVFQLHGVDHNEKVVLKKQLTRTKILVYFQSFATLFNWDGSLWKFTLLGKRITKIRAYGKTDGSAVCKTLCEK